MSLVEKELDSIMEGIFADYSEKKFIDKVDISNQPDKKVITDILAKLQEIIFPGFFKPDTYKSYTVKTTISMLVEDVLYNLKKEIGITLKYNPIYSDSSACEIQGESQRIAVEFLKKIPKIREYIETDVSAAFDGDPAAYNKEEIVVTYPGFYAIMVYRIAHELHVLNVPLIPRIMTEHAHSLTGIDIHPGAQIGKYFFIDHGTGIVIGETTIIGDNVKIYQGVTLGALSTRGGQMLKNVKRHPTIEDNVTIYSGATILGGETIIGKDVVIGGNTFITSSVLEGTKVSVKQPELKFKK
ncbi:MAG: serine acetyltransferase [Clostridiales bacterium]|nr:serine acetyltransferase [Clostridiales bacterium]